MLFNHKKDPDKDAMEYSKKQEKYDEKLKKLEQKQGFLNKINAIKFPTYTKNLVAIIIGVCLIDLQLSYILSFMGKDPCLDLSIKLCETILGVSFAYILRAYFDNKAEYAAKNGDCVKKGLFSNISKAINKKIGIEEDLFSEEDFICENPDNNSVENNDSDN